MKTDKVASNGPGALWNRWIASIDIRSYTMIFALIGIWVLFSFMSDFFLTSRNLSNLFVQMSVTAVLAIGMLLVIVAGHIDLSVGSIVGLTGGLAAILQVWAKWPTWSVVIVTILAGVLIGLIQGWWVAYRSVPAFIVTLGGMMAFRGILTGITKGQTVAPMQESFRTIGQSYLPQGVGLFLGIVIAAALLYGLWNARRSRIKYGFEVGSPLIDTGKAVFFIALTFIFIFLMSSYKGVPFPFLLVIIFAVIFTFLANKTTFGRHIYAIGGNNEAARLSGINIKRRTLMVFVLSATMASIAGIMQVARLNAATISSGTMYELDAIAACVIGGTSLMGGRGKISGVIIGALVMASLDNGMSIMNVESFWQQITKGAILVLAVWIDIYSQNRKKSGKVA
ncbi:sugar ABC transporter permease [Effusibacillus lacus]|uniref:Xylose transport system permease protein XylH n=1 Tax=Effusibacillus lacus TaxID=1348429 RepID=A0A292YR78_9BACL|nr:sugar ABC transporter permease [Effusibacillus lacus]